MSKTSKKQRPVYTNTPAVPSAPQPFILLRPAVQIGLLLLLGFGIYLNTLHVPFIFDDRFCILNNPAIRNLDYFFNFDLVQALHIPQDLKNSFALRPVVYLTFAFNYFLGSTHEFGFHLVNIAIHLGNAVLVYQLVRVTLRLAPLPSSRTDLPPWNRILPLLVALLFIVHPIQTQAVSYISQRFTSLVALFYFSSLLLYIQAQLAERLAVRRCCYGLALLITILAMKSKETAFTLPIMLLFYDSFFLSGTWRERCYRLLPFFLSMVIIPVTLLGLTQAESVTLTEEALTESINLVNFKGVSNWDYLQTQFGVIVVYLRLLFLPIGQNFDPDYRLAKSFFEWRVVGALLILLSIFGSAVFLTLRSFREKNRQGERIIAFGIFWFFVTLSVESSIIPINDLLLEYRIYLPSFGIFLALGTAAGLAVNRGTLPWRGLIAGAILIITILATATVARNHLYRDTIRFMQDIVTKSPEKPRAHSLLGEAYLRDQRLDEAEVEFNKYLRLRPNDPDIILNLGSIYLFRGEIAKATEQYERSLKLAPDNYMAHANLAICYSNVGKMAEAEKELLTSLAINPNFRTGLRNLASLYENLGRNAEAIVQYRKLLEYFPKDQDALERLRILTGNDGSTGELK